MNMEFDARALADAAMKSLKDDDENICELTEEELDAFIEEHSVFIEGEAEVAITETIAMLLRDTTGDKEDKE